MRDWVDEAFFAETDPPSVDGGSTSHGPLWHEVSQRWGHSMHAMCSYQGMFPARLAHYFVASLTSPGDVVLDPFSGRGTTVLQARVEGRHGIGNDLNPLAFVLTRAKAAPPTWDAVIRRVDELEEESIRSKAEFGAPDEIRMLFHPITLGQLLFLRNYLQGKGGSRWTAVDFMIAGAVAGILHGGDRSDGTSAYLSISMPNTFSMSPDYVAAYIRENGLPQRPYSVFSQLRAKLGRLYLDDVAGMRGRAVCQDATRLLTRTLPAESIDLVLTSPPYLKVVNYGTANWIRLWWLGLDDVSRENGQGRKRLDAMLDHQHNYDRYRRFMLTVLRGLSRVLRRDGLAALVIGDVMQPGNAPSALAERLWADIGEESGLELTDVVVDALASSIKVSRIWGETKGRATEVERILILKRADGAGRQSIQQVSWDEPYRDAGQDGAHRMAQHRGNRRSSSQI
jgi:hypothetical protein